MLFRFVLLLLAAGPAAAAPPETAAAAETVAHSAVVVMYHRFGERKFPATNITLEQFEAHIDILKSGRYTVLPLPEIVEKLRKGESLPERTVGISIDDAYRSTFTEAWPRLKKAGLAFTVFVSTDHIDRKLVNMMTWDQIRTLVKDGVTIGHHTASHLHMADQNAARNGRDIEQASKRFKEELGFVPKIFAYPYGEASLATIRLIKAAGFAVAFGQHSGAIDRTADFHYLPRFAMNETYGTAARFKLAVDAIALPVTDITPEDPMIGKINPPAVGFTVAAPIKNLQRLSCYSSHAGRAAVTQLGARRIEVRIDKAFPPGRTRLNCTLPGADGRWHWFGRQFYLPRKG
ncbi:MAG: polysaccharide deacetylase family protein [Rhodospirillales bacterium]